MLLIAGQPTTGFDALNTYYQVVFDDVVGTNRLLTFCDSINIDVLRAEYEALPEVQGVLGSSGNPRVTYTVSELGDTYRYAPQVGYYRPVAAGLPWRLPVPDAEHVI